MRGDCSSGHLACAFDRAHIAARGLLNMARLITLAALALVFAGSVTPAHAQGDFFRMILRPPRMAPPPPQKAAPAPGAIPARVAPPDQKAKVTETPPAYEQEMSRLAEILGALHFLRPLCGSQDGSRWRNEMQGLIETEQAPPERRDRMIASFNRSYVAYEQTYRTCTPAAGVAIRRYLDEGAKIAREITARYTN
jgi:uncharacterized protein (TIGR02301 family)